MPPGCIGDLAVRVARRQPYRQVQAAISTFNDMRHWHMPGQRFSQRMLPVAIQTPHAAQMPAELTTLNELGKRELFIAVTASQHVVQGGAHLLYQRRRQDKKP